MVGGGPSACRRGCQGERRRAAANALDLTSGGCSPAVPWWWCGVDGARFSPQCRVTTCVNANTREPEPWCPVLSLGLGHAGLVDHSRGSASSSPEAEWIHRDPGSPASVTPSAQSVCCGLEAPGGHARLREGTREVMTQDPRAKTEPVFGSGNPSVCGPQPCFRSSGSCTSHEANPRSPP